MKTKIENFIVDVSEDDLSLSYSRSVKNLLSLLFSVVSALFCLSVGGFLVYLMVQEGFEWVYALFIVILWFVGVVQLDKS